MTRNRTLIIGLGSPHGDDSVGWRIIERLQADAALVAEFRIAAHPIDILDHFDGASEAHIIDACRAGGRPGELYCWQWPEFAERGATARHSSHAMSLEEALRLGERLALLPRRLMIWGVEVGTEPRGATMPAELDPDELPAVDLPAVLAALVPRILAERRTGAALRDNQALSRLPARDDA